MKKRTSRIEKTLQFVDEFERERRRIQFDIDEIVIRYARKMGIPPSDLFRVMEANLAKNQRLAKRAAGRRLKASRRKK